MASRLALLFLDPETVRSKSGPGNAIEIRKIVDVDNVRAHCTIEDQHISAKESGQENKDG